jgi:predicted Zn-dependent peptidase
MSLESTSSRCEQLAQHLLVFGRPFDAGEIVRRIEAVTPDDVAAVARRVTAGRPTITALGPIGRIEAFDRIAARFAR